jgi:phage terminase large subunit
MKSLERKCRILCTREFQSSIGDSVHKLLADIISELKLDRFFNVGQQVIRNIYGSEFIFKGIKKNPREIKSIEGIDYCWVEEAADVSVESWDILEPTIRKPGSQIIVTFNPEDADQETFRRFVLKQPPRSNRYKINYYDNPFASKENIEQAEYDKKVNPEKYDWVWDGNPRLISDAQIFKGKVFVEDFETPPIETLFEKRFFYGADWGFNPDPLAAHRSFIVENNLFIDHEVYKVNVELSNIGKELDKIPGFKKGNSYGDSARPDIISMLQAEGFNIRPVSKAVNGKAMSVQPYINAGIEYLKNFEKIIVHPRCKNIADEFKLYSYKVDKNTGEILPLVVDAHNHGIDDIRYSHSTYITPQKTIRSFSF